MFELNFKIMVDIANEDIIYFVGDFLKDKDHGDIRRSHFADHHVISCPLFINDNQTPSNLFRLGDKIKQRLESRKTSVLQIIIGGEYPEIEHLNNRSGFWISAELQRWKELIIGDATLISRDWSFLPFREENNEEYALFKPDNEIRLLGIRINELSRLMNISVGLKICLSEKYSISDYISSAFSESLENFYNLGGLNVISTTILQMNKKISLINSYLEELTESENLNLYNFSAMNMLLTDKSDKTSIVNLVSSGILIINEIRMGE